MTDRYRIGIVGGVQRIERAVATIAEEVGIEVEMHTGHTTGQHASRLKALVRRVHMVVVVTGTNSHNAVNLVKREAERCGVPMRIVKSCGVDAARALFKSVLDARAA